MEYCTVTIGNSVIIILPDGPIAQFFRARYEGFIWKCEENDGKLSMYFWNVDPADGEIWKELERELQINGIGRKESEKS